MISPEFFHIQNSETYFKDESLYIVFKIVIEIL